MKAIKIIFFVLISNSLFALDIYEEISNAIRSGDAHQLSTYFGNNIDLSLADKENVYSKAQAELILKDFFSKNPPKSFTIIHKGSSPDGIKYVIGNLVTTNGKNFRTSFYIKNIAGKYVLQEMSIESE